MVFRWFSSRTVRQAADLAHRVEKLIRAQRDLLPGPAIENVTSAVNELRALLRSGGSKPEIEAAVQKLETTANKWLRPYPNAVMRENLDVILVALVVALGIRTFFLQPMAIPTGSMQPTLYGITHENYLGQEAKTIPNPIVRLFQRFVFGQRYYHVTAIADGEFKGFYRPEKAFLFFTKQRFVVGNAPPYTVWSPPDKFEEWSGLRPGQTFKAGQDILKMKITSGDRLFSDRFTYNFRKPSRGEIIIFETDGIQALQQGTHYIKRLVGLGGETISLSADRHAVVNGVRLDAATPRFENLYSFTGPPQRSRYSGHVLLSQLDPRPPADSYPYFQVPLQEFQIKPKHYFVLGDNTVDSYDSRYWGDFPREKVSGKCSFVFWPISSRFGWGFR